MLSIHAFNSCHGQLMSVAKLCGELLWYLVMTLRSRWVNRVGSTSVNETRGSPVAYDSHNLHNKAALLLWLELLAITRSSTVGAELLTTWITSCGGAAVNDWVSYNFWDLGMTMLRTMRIEVSLVVEIPWDSIVGISCRIMGVSGVNWYASFLMGLWLYLLVFSIMASV